MNIKNKQTLRNASLKHIAVIMDGNGRWATAKGLPRSFGHKQGAKAAQRLLEAAQQLNIEYLTLFAFSVENWQRPKEEIEQIFTLIEQYLCQQQKQIHKNKVRFRVLGIKEKLPVSLQTVIKQMEGETKGYSKYNLQLAINYSGRQEIVHAAKKLSQACMSGQLESHNITEKHFQDTLFAPDIPAPELVIRTSGEQRISNFLLWQIAYAEFVFLNKMWPDFQAQDLTYAINQFKQRSRRFGK